MIRFAARDVAAIGEAMVEIAPVEGGLCKRGFAGDTYNTLWHMAQLMPDGTRLRLVTRIGQDALSTAFADMAAADGIDTSAMRRDPARGMGLYLVALDGVERSFHYWRGESAARRLADDPADLADGLRGAGLIHLSGITLAILAPPAREALFAAIATARAAGAVVSFDPNLRLGLWPSPEEARKVMLHMLGLTDIALPGFEDEATLWNDTNPAATLDRLRQAGVVEVVLTQGNGAVWLADDNGTLTIPTPPVANVRDTTGAGDGFNAGYLAARLMGRTPIEAVAAGQCLAAEVICHFGAHVPRAVARGIGFRAGGSMRGSTG